MKYLFIAICATLIMIAFVLAGLFFLGQRASNNLLYQIALLQPDMNLDEVKNKLGEQMYEIRDANEIIALGSIKDSAFCRNKKLFLFNALSISSCRVLEVYTDPNNIIVYVTWHGL